MSKSIWKQVFVNFINSLKPRRFTGDLKGTDTFGNKYYEIPADRSVGRSKASRWYQPTVKDKYDQEMPAEWEAWLRYRRDNPPTLEEVAKNDAIAELKKVNAQKLEEKYHPGAPPKEEKIMDFPRFKEYEIMPGELQDKEKK